jgi:hypothetical protein
MFLLSLLLASQLQVPADPVFAACAVNENNSPTVFAGSGEICVYDANSIVAIPYGDGTGFISIPSNSWVYGYSKVEVRFPFNNDPPSNTPKAPTYFVNETIPIVPDMLFRNGIE